MRNFVFILCAFVTLSTGCTKERFIKKLVGTYTVNSFIKDSKDRTNEFKAEKQDYTLVIEDNNNFTETYLLNGLVYRKVSGEWQLINSSKDLQMVDPLNNVRMFNIVKMGNKSMTLVKGNEEYQFIEK